MAEGLIVGFDLCKDYCRVSFFEEGAQEPKDLVFTEEGNPCLVQNSICKKKGEDVWLIGQDAYETALLGGGSIVDKVLRLVERGGFTTFEGVRYSAEDLLYHFLDEVLKVLYVNRRNSEIKKIVFSVQELSGVVLDTVLRCTKRLGLKRDAVHIVSHTESYLFYVLSQKRDLWSNLSVLFDLSGDGLNYYELEVLRGMQPNVAIARREFLEEGFSLGILETGSGMKLADSIMTSCVDRMLSKKIVTSCYLSGKGMDNCQTWGENFLRVLCNRRRVFFTENLFAKGAVYQAVDLLREKSVYNCRVICEGRIGVDIHLDVVQGVTAKTLELAGIGTNWYESQASVDIIPDQESSLKLRVRKLFERQTTTVEIPFADLGFQRNKMNRVHVDLRFTAENTFTVTLTDKGFGEILPGSGKTVQRTFTIG